ncbi:TRAP transporter large permease [Desulfoluna spongiiphila]|uniref:TRAP transporter, DctM subunit n=1 Tax=Desulfoluna spongiiphila TaxID=419481 RepID=A0A1G5IAF5_9BACT|nr:TRAP transporter large permease subunit [Desulfoluna spongiiphila]SCY72579.1 TRAP transporter, DctM subunit [Desulfoluna spongiiphila]VVS93183.1 trap c4-dicarboxylate transport system permease dctm subunit [Desulfoluna spongiiphila]
MFHLSSLGVEGGTFLLFGSMIVLLLMGQPLAYLTGLVAMFFAIGWFGPNVLPLLTSRIYSFVGEYTLIAVPMFVFMASLLDSTNIAKDLYNAMQAFGGRLKGGVAVQTLIVAVFLAAMSGIIGGETVLLGMLALPQMLRLGYDKKLAIGTVCAGGSLGTMVPPSIVLIIYGLTASVSIGDLFAGAVVPALMLAGFYMAYILIRCHLNPNLGPSGMPADTGKPKKKMLLDILAPGLIVLCVLGSIYGGIASVTEAASVGVASVMILSAFRRELNLGVIQQSLRQTMRTCGMIIWIGISASALIGIYNLMGGNRFVKSAILGLDVAPVVIIFVMMLILIFLGMFMDWIGVALLTMPIFVPIITGLGYDPVWFGVLFCMNMQVSFLSPPFGPAAFYLKSVAPPEVTLVDIFKSVWPFILMQLLALGLLIAFPQLALWLPNL